MDANLGVTAAEFLRDNAQTALFGDLKSHPDDDLVRDLPIDDEDWSIDWPSDFADRNNFSEKHCLDWPEDWPVTIRNYGKWLDMGLCAGSKNGPSTSSG